MLHDAKQGYTIKYCGSTLKYGKEINATFATPQRVAFIYYRN